MRCQYALSTVWNTRIKQLSKTVPCLSRSTCIKSLSRFSTGYPAESVKGWCPQAFGTAELKYIFFLYVSSLCLASCKRKQMPELCGQKGLVSLSPCYGAPWRRRAVQVFRLPCPAGRTSSENGSCPGWLPQAGGRRCSQRSLWTDARFFHQHVCWHCHCAFGLKHMPGAEAGVPATPTSTPVTLLPPRNFPEMPFWPRRTSLQVVPPTTCPR